jgi:hypothetical protein
LLRVSFYPDAQQQAQYPPQERAKKCMCHVNYASYLFD